MMVYNDRSGRMPRLLLALHLSFALLFVLAWAPAARAQAPVTAGPQPPDFAALAVAADNWDDRFGIPGLTREVRALALQGNDLYVGGLIFSTGLAEQEGLARWDGRRWHSVGGGVDDGSGSVGVVNAIAVAGDKVYVGGEFKRAGSVAANNIAVWDGAKWSALGGGLTGDIESVKALAVDPQGNLYVGGSFTRAGNVDVSGIARWNGSAWSSLGEGLGTEFSPGTVHALAWWNGKLYAGGEFSQSGGATLNGVAAWNGSTWEALGDGVTDSGFAGEVYAFEPAGAILYVGGAFTEAGRAPASRIAAWNGSSWSALGEGLGIQGSSETVRALKMANGRLYAGGEFTSAGGRAANRIAYWQGGGWHALEQGGVNGVGTEWEGAVLALAPLGVDLYVGGNFELAGDTAVNHIAAWTGSGWRSLGQGIGGGAYWAGLVEAVAVAGDGSVYVGGSFDYAGGVPAKNIAMWDGFRWHPLGDGADSWVWTIKIVGNEVYVGGDFTAVGGEAASRIAMWNHATKTWSALGSGVSDRVADIDIDGEWVYAAGNFTAAGEISVSKAARWNRMARTWTDITTVPIRIDNAVHAIEAEGPDVFLGGDFLYVIDANDDYITVNSLVWWNDVEKAWFKVDDGVMRPIGGTDYNGTVWDLLLVGNSMFVAGDFDKAGPIAAKSIARYDFGGNGWNALGSGLGGGATSTEGFALALKGQDVLVGGSFRTAGGVVTNHIARWSILSGQWSAVGAGMGPFAEAEVQDVAATSQSIYAVGAFDTAGGLPSSSFARFGPGAQPPPMLPQRLYLPLLRR